MAAHAGAGVDGQAGFPPGRLPDAQVREMFERIAGLYDPMNTAMTAGLHHRWRARAAELARVGPGARVLDVATGTGDLALEFARRVHPGGEVVGVDFAEAMLARARAKAAEGGERAPTHFQLADALALPFPAASFDAASAGFGVRNFGDLRRGLSEMARVVRPGGRMVVLEITTPAPAPGQRAPGARKGARRGAAGQARERHDPGRPQAPAPAARARGLRVGGWPAHAAARRAGARARRRCRRARALGDARARRPHRRGPAAARAAHRGGDGRAPGRGGDRRPALLAGLRAAGQERRRRAAARA